MDRMVPPALRAVFSCRSSVLGKKLAVLSLTVFGRVHTDD